MSRVSPDSIASALRVARRMTPDGQLDAHVLLALQVRVLEYFVACDAFAVAPRTEDLVALADRVQRAETALRRSVGLLPTGDDLDPEIVNGLDRIRQDMDHAAPERPSWLRRLGRWLVDGWS